MVDHGRQTKLMNIFNEAKLEIYRYDLFEGVMIFNRFYTSLFHARFSISQHFYSPITKEFSQTVDSGGRMLGTKARPELARAKSSLSRVMGLNVHLEIRPVSCLVPRPTSVVSWRLHVYLEIHPVSCLVPRPPPPSVVSWRLHVSLETHHVSCLVPRPSGSGLSGTGVPLPRATSFRSRV
jgi:hypothetical protein